MRRLVLFFWIVCAFLSTTILFQNCSKYQPELNASSGYSVDAESISESTSATEAVLVEIMHGSSVQFSQSVPEFSNIWAPVFAFSMNDARIDPYTSYLCQVDSGSWQACSSPLKLEDLNDGMHSLSVKGVFKATTYSMPKVIVWTKDSLAPLVSFNKTPPMNIGINEVEITFSATDGGSGIAEYSCLFDNQEWKTCTSPVFYTDLANGPHSLKVRVADRAGNINEVSNNWNIDPSYPYISMTGKPSEFTKNSEASFYFQVMNGLSFNQFECLFDDQKDFSPCVSGIKYSLPNDGLYSFKVRAKDEQGYYTNTLIYQFYRDATAPKITLVSPEKKATLRNSLVIAANIDDSELGVGINSVSCTIESLINSESKSRTINNCSFPLDLSAELTGKYELTIVATDKLGTKSTSDQFQFYYINEERNPAFLTINLSGGAALMANIIPLDENSTFLNSYSRMGMGNKAFVENNHEQFLGAKWYKTSGLMKGIKKHLQSEATEKVRAFALPVSSVDNTDNNPFDIQSYIASAGLHGTFIRATASANGKMLNGINETTIFYDKTELELDIPAVFRPFFGFLDLANHAGYTNLADFPMIENHNAYKNDDFVNIFGADAVQTGTTAASKQIIYNSINGNSGPANLNFGSFDYRNVSRATADARDEVIGEWIGKAMQYAFVAKRKLMIYVPTDGSVASVDSTTGGGAWTADRGAAGQILFFAIDPLANAENNFGNSDYMIGNFLQTQEANDAFWSTDDKRPDAREVAGLAVVANYLQLAGKGSKIETVTQSVIKQTDINKYVRIKAR